MVDYYDVMAHILNNKHVEIVFPAWELLYWQDKSPVDPLTNVG